uniref:Cytochrome c biogenesis protein CcsA n=1 Tax=Pseudochlorodesmis sp. HV01306c TaxID=2358490 RepID=A0A386AYG3_9CHLO|nr:cytochrome c biogenesis protein Ccs1 [Pseudochlorodesmis sp. HV01306c]
MENPANFLSNCSFLFLFFSMSFYWVRAFFNISIFSLFSRFGKWSIIGANLAMLFLLIYRGFYENHFPLSNLYEALIFLSWSFTVIHLIVENLLTDFIVGAITAPTALFINAFASFELPESFQKFTPLIPALKSNWLMMHVTVMLLSYAALICGCILSIAFLFLFEKKFEKSIDISNSIFKKNHVEPLDPLVEKIFKITQKSILNPPTPTKELIQNIKKQNSSQLHKNNSNDSKVVNIMKNYFLENRKMYLLNNLDQLSFRAIGIGFPLLTIGILSGSIWANEAWGSYWSWDPKETWSLITWLIFAIYLHLRLTQKWNGVKSAILATCGFFVVWICFLGVNFLAQGLHSYGWFS